MYTQGSQTVNLPGIRMTNHNEKDIFTQVEIRDYNI